MTPLQSIPASIRVRAYWVGYVLGVLSLGIATVWGVIASARPDVEMPLWLLVAVALIAFAQTQLNLLAGSNVSDPNTVTTQAPADATVHTEVDLPPDVAPHDDYAAGDPSRH